MFVRPVHIASGLALSLGAVLMFVPLAAHVPASAPPALWRTAGLVVMTVGLWATAVVPLYFTSVMFLFAAIALALAPPRVVFSGFASSAVWLVFGGLVLGLAVHKTGLGRRMVSLMLRHFPLSYRGTIWALVLVGAVLAFLIPSAVGRVILLVPIVLALAERLKFAAGSNGKTGMVLAAGMGTTFPAFAVLPSNVPNMSLIGAAESIYGIKFTYGEYLLLNYPVMAVFGLIALPLLICRMFPDEPHRGGTGHDDTAASGDDRRLMLILCIAVGFWVTDFVHGVAPAWVAMGAAILCLLPWIGVLPATVLSKEIDYGSWLFVAGIIGLGAVVTHTGLGTAIAKELFAVVPLASGEGPRTFASLFGVGAIVAIFTTLPAAPGIMTPLADVIATATGWPVKSVLLAQVPTWVVFPAPYQAPPLIVTLALGGVGMAPALRLLLVYAVSAIVVMLPLQYLWGRWLGVYP